MVAVGEVGGQKESRLLLMLAESNPEGSRKSAGVDGEVTSWPSIDSFVNPSSARGMAGATINPRAARAGYSKGEERT